MNQTNEQTAEKRAEPDVACSERLGRGVPDALVKIGQNLATQDNRFTEAPIFVVQQRRRIHGADDGEGFEWYERDEWEKVDAAKAAELEEHYDTFLEQPDGYTRVTYLDVWEFVTACFTAQGCKDYIAANGHNLTEPRIYAEGSWRNAEWQTVRNWLLEQAA